MEYFIAEAGSEVAGQRLAKNRSTTPLRLIFSLAFVLALLFFPSITTGQESPITASVNKSDFSTDELVILTVVVVDDSALQPRPILPPLDGLAVVDLDIATDVSTVSGKIRTAVTYTYRLQPRRTGLLIIPAVRVKIDEQSFQAAPVSIRVSQGAPPAPSTGNAVQPADITPPAALTGQDFFVESTVDKPRPYLGQQVTYTFRFYQAIQLYRQPQYEGPLFIGFETMGMPVQEYNIEFDGRTYLITEIRTALFPKEAGKVTIGPARLMFPGNIYEEPLELYTEPIIMETQTLPGNVPPGFGGAVGQYEIQSWFSPQVAIINQPSSFFIAISGTGNVQALPEPVWPDLEGWRTYDSLTSLTTDMKDSLMTGTRVYERMVVPDRTGEFTIPPATLIFFDPLAAEYRTVSTEPISVKVIPAPTPDPAVPTATPLGATPTATPASVAVVPGSPPADSRGVNPVFPDTDLTGWQVPLPVFAVLFLILCGAVPLAAVAGATGVWFWQKQRIQQEQKKDEPAGPLKLPSQRIHPVLAAAMQSSSDNYRTVAEALYTYLNQVLETPVKSLTRTELVQRLRRRGLSEELVHRTEACLNLSDEGRYGMVNVDGGWGLMEMAEKLLFDLDEALRISK